MIKKIITSWWTVLFVMVISVTSVVLALREDEKKNTEIREKINIQKEANSLISRITYIKDPRGNGICFAYLEEYSGDFFTFCPCESIPPELLITAKIPKQSERNR